MRGEYRHGELYAMLQAENADVLIHPDDRKYGTLLVGGQGTGKTSALLSFYKNVVRREANTAPIVIDPKSELARVCLRMTPPDCGKRVWFLDLGHPAFGMNPLRLIGDRALAIEAAQIAENIVAALLDINENQIYQSSRRYLYHAVIGAIAIGSQEQRRAKLEDVYTLLRPARDDFRAAVAEACAIEPDLDQTAEFFRSELPDDLRMSAGRVAERLDAPRNKISGLIGVPPLRRFFNHPTDIPLREIIEARDILIVDANMAAIGTENSKACMLFILRMLNAQLQRQVHLPERDRPRVPLLVDEAHYILAAESVVDQVATHRAGGLEPAFGVQYFAQLGSGSEHQEKILKGVLNLLQNRFLFRMGDAQDAEQASRIAMAVYATMIRDDPDSRARLRVTPEQLLNFPNYFCLASWIANGNRAPAFTGQTFPLPQPGDQWTEAHLAAQAERVGPYPEHLESTLDTRPSEALDADTGETTNEQQSARGRREYLRVPYEEKDAAKRLGARWDPSAERWYIPAGRDPEPLARWRLPPPATDSQPATSTPAPTSGNRDHPTQAREAANGVPPPETAARAKTQPDPAARRRPPKREVHVDYQPPPPPPKLDDSPVRRVVGRRIPGAPPGAHAAPAPDSLRELAFLDRINEVGTAEQHHGAARLPRLYDEDYAILALLDRAGLVPRTLIGKACLPGRTANPVMSRLVKLHRHGLIAEHPVGIREHTRADGKAPLLYSLTRRGTEVAQTREPPAISRRREWRPVEQGRALRLAHDLHALAWGIELHRLVGDAATDHWRTPRYATGRYQVPQAGSGRDRHPLTLNEIPVPEKQAIVDLTLKQFAEVKPDLSLELRIPSSFDLLVELDLTSRPSYNREKLLAYDAFLCGWSLAHPRYQTQGTRPAVVFVCPDTRAALNLAREADDTLTGCIGVMGTSREHWYHAGRDHVFFAVEADIHHRDLAALALPARPPGLRERLTGTRELELERVALLPTKLLNANPIR